MLNIEIISRVRCLNYKVYTVIAIKCLYKTFVDSNIWPSALFAIRYFLERTAKY